MSSIFYCGKRVCEFYLLVFVVDDDIMCWCFGDLDVFTGCCTASAGCHCLIILSYISFFRFAPGHTQYRRQRFPHPHLKLHFHCVLPHCFHVAAGVVSGLSKLLVVLSFLALLRT